MWTAFYAQVVLGKNDSDAALDALWNALNTANSVAHLRESVVSAIPSDPVIAER